MIVSDRVKYAIKYAVAHLLYGIGLLQLWQRVALRRRAVILMYHRVLTPEEMRLSGSHPAMVIGCDTFAEQMAIVRKRFKILSMHEFSERIERKIPFENSSCLITFDDGWVDNYTNALPILRRHQLPAAVFLPVNFVGSNRLFWQESLVHLLVLAVMKTRSDPSSEARLRSVLDPIGLGGVLVLRETNLCPPVIEAISKTGGRLTPATVEAALGRLRNELGVENSDSQRTDRFVNWEQVAKMAESGVTFGSHGSEHRLLSEISVDDAREDIQKSKEVMDVYCKGVAPVFSYPRGYWTPQVAELVKRAGFRLAFLARGGTVSCHDDRFLLPRINICQAATESSPMFLARVVGLF